MHVTAADELPAVLDTAGVAELLGLNTRTVGLMVRDGRLPARRLPGSRKYQFLTSEVLAALTPGDGEASGVAVAAPPPSRVAEAPAPLDADPCDVWGAAPAGRGTGWASRCLDHWLALAADAGLTVTCITSPTPDTAGPVVGVVEIDELTYRVLTGLRKRVRIADDDGEVRWGLIDSVWAEPVVDHDGYGAVTTTSTDARRAT